MGVALYARISIHDQQTLARPIDAIRPEEKTAAAAAWLVSSRRCEGVGGEGSMDQGVPCRRGHRPPVTPHTPVAPAASRHHGDEGCTPPECY